MCTVTFVPRSDGFYLAMNRDEQITRPSANPPAIFQQGGVENIYPLDNEGGTWIAANSRGAAFTLLNWNDTQKLGEKSRTRGSIVPAVVSSNCSEVVQSTLVQLDLDGILPFRLVGFFSAQKDVTEWRWDQRSLERKSMRWTMRQWCSSSLSDAKASSTRGKMFEQEATELDAGSLAWLRRLHASHNQGNRSFSHCVHRGNVETLSYTELISSDRAIECNYLSCSPCRAGQAVHRVSLGR
jgi:hypothetical protein